MKPMDLDHVVRSIDRRLERVEQILPTLPTRDVMHAAIRDAVAPLVTREELDRKVATLVTKEELREEAERSRTYTQVHYEDLKDGIRLLADGVVKVQTTLDQMVRPKLEDHERRITALEDARGRAGGSRRR